jgi:hypothetical protein
MKFFRHMKNEAVEETPEGLLQSSQWKQHLTNVLEYLHYIRENTGGLPPMDEQFEDQWQVLLLAQNLLSTQGDVSDQESDIQQAFEYVVKTANITDTSLADFRQAEQEELAKKRDARNVLPMEGFVGKRRGQLR